MDFLRDRLALAPVQALRAMHRYLAKAGGSCGGATRPPGAPPSPHAAIVHAVQQKHASDPWLQVPDCCRFWGLRRVSLLQSLSGDLQTAVVASGPATASARGFQRVLLVDDPKSLESEHELSWRILGASRDCGRLYGTCVALECISSTWSALVPIGGRLRLLPCLRTGPEAHPESSFPPPQEEWARQLIPDGRPEDALVHFKVLRQASHFSNLDHACSNTFKRKETCARHTSA